METEWTRTIAEAKAALERIKTAAQAGTVGDTAAAEHAFAIISRAANRCGDLLDTLPNSP